MLATGILAEDERIELVEGEIVAMAPIGSRHLGCVNFLTRQLSKALDGLAIVSVQNPVSLDDFSEPQPDLAVLRFRSDDYREAVPTAADVLLLIEVADASLDFDRRVKVPLYASAGIPEVWVVDLVQTRIEVHRSHEGSRYRETLVVRSGETLFSGAFPDLQLETAAILG